MAHPILQELHRDHVNITRVLHILDRMLLQPPGEGDVNMALMIDIIDYVEHYPDLVHHPKEDLLYKAYKAKSLEATEIVNGLLKQHQELPVLTRVFRKLLEEVNMGAVIISRDELYQKAHDYIDYQLEHLNTEEALMFPMIVSTFDQADWDALVAIIPVHKDPLFVAELDRYENLLAYLKTMEQTGVHEVSS